jgi:hypothetical protein
MRRQHLQTQLDSALQITSAAQIGAGISPAVTGRAGTAGNVLVAEHQFVVTNWLEREAAGIRMLRELVPSGRYRARGDSRFLPSGRFGVASMQTAVWPATTA